MKLKLGMIGGGQDAFIGAVHRMAARLDGRYELTVGAFSSNPDTSRAMGALLGLAPTRPRLVGVFCRPRRWRLQCGAIKASGGAATWFSWPGASMP